MHYVTIVIMVFTTTKSLCSMFACTSENPLLLGMDYNKVYIINIIIIIIAIIKIVCIIIIINKSLESLLYLESSLFLHLLCTGLLFERQVFIKIFQLLQMLHVVLHLSLKFLIYFTDSDNKQTNKTIIQETQRTGDFFPPSLLPSVSQSKKIWE